VGGLLGVAVLGWFLVGFESKKWQKNGKELEKRPIGIGSDKRPRPKRRGENPSKKLTQQNKS
jgi:hypothetical protein